MDMVEHQIRERARWFWMEAGKPEGRDLEFWLQAEQSFMDGSAVSRAEELHKREPEAPLTDLAFRER